MRDDAEIRQLEEDRRDFDRYFRPRDDPGTVTGGAGIREIRSFLSNTLNVAHWNLPTDNTTVERMLRQAVKHGRLVPVVNRECGSLVRVSRPTPSPLRWPSSGGGYGGGSKQLTAFANAGPRPFVFSGEPVLSGPYDPATREAQISAARGAMTVSDGGSDLFGVLERIAGAALGIDSGADEAAGGNDEAFTLLADEQPFEYGKDLVSAESEEIAGMPFNGTPGSWISSMPGTMPQMRQYGANGTPLTDFDLESHHGNPNPHAHNWVGHNRDAGAPVSILPW
ncbi:MAG: hypothetical protein AB1704_28430 [Pseudomonadota bacterium]|jgi:hypothetical protein|uniref:hypothetical protein n=1 Tax=Burkholderiaceae TaxID=119060 RepID=UPI0010F6412A|nr:hypothetical protein [Burkholderia sp. 4M9327F10]